MALPMLATPAGAQSAVADPYNTYLWNRDNALAGNGQVDRGQWFEWWYYKVVDPVTGQAFFFTYGVINPWDLGHSSPISAAIMQVGDFQQNFMIEQKIPLEQFTASYQQTDVAIGQNHATDKRIQGHLTGANGHDVAWDLSMNKSWAFDAMGWLMTMAGFSGIYWYPAQASATMTGWLKVDGATINLTNAPAYQDRNWGRTFPKWWTWLTSNNFKNSPGTALAAGGGEPKIFDTIFLTSGLCVGLNYQGQEYVFRSSSLDTFDFDIQWGKWSVTAENGSNQRIEINAYAPPEQFIDIAFQPPEGGTFHDYEALLGQMTVKLSEWDFAKGAWNVVADLQTDEAGIEWGSPNAVGSMDKHNFSTLFNTSTRLK